MLAREQAQQGSKAARIAIVAAACAAVVIVAFALFGGGSSYTVSATFANASQLVEGNEVRMGGVRVGSVKELRLEPDSRVRVTMEIEGEHAPLDRGTEAIIRQTSLSGIANRYVDLQLPGGETGEAIPDGGEIAPERAKAAVEVDAVVNTFDPRTREALRRLVRGSARALEGQGAAAREGLRYLSPALAATRKAFEQLAADTALLERFVVDSAGLVTTVARRRGDLSELVANLDEATAAASEDTAALAGALERLPGFLRRANTTFVNLRGALDDLDPVVAAAKPVARELRPFLPDLRTLAAEGEPTVRDLARAIRADGEANDLLDLLRTAPRLARVAVDRAKRNGAERPGAFAQTSEALREATPIIAFGRFYAPDLVGWFDDFSHTGGYDAIGGYARGQVYVNLLSAALPNVPLLDPVERINQFLGTARTRQFKRCPGAAEAPAADGSNVWSKEEQELLDCEESHRAVGP